MTGSRQPRMSKHSQYHIHMKGFLFVIAVVLLVVARAMATAVSDDDTATSTECSGLVTCAECRRVARCGWSSERQTCGTAGGAGSVTGCSSVRAVTRPVAGGDARATYAYAIVVSGDGQDVRLAGADLRCHVGDTVARAASVQVRAGEPGGPATVRIECPPEPLARLLRDGHETDVRHAHVAADGVPLWPDRPDDRYFAVNRETICDQRRRDWTDECARCAWTDRDGYAHYARLCPRRVVPCAGPRAFYDRRSAATLLAGVPPRSAVVAVPPSPCPQLRVRSFTPASGPWTGGFALHVRVTNHAVLSERVAPVVTVAGRPCLLLPTAAGGRDDEMTCTVAPFAATDSVVVRGPVRVRYDAADPPQDAVAAVELTSVQDFAFGYPRIANVSRHSTLGPDRGGRTELTVSGEHLGAGHEVRVTVGDAECAVTDHTDDRVRCVVDGADAATTGRITVQFHGGSRAAALRIHVVQSPWSVRVGDPALDPEQPSFGGIESGGTTVTVRGVRLFGLGDARIHVRRPYDGTWTAGERCRVRHDDYMTCLSPDVRTLVRAPATLESSVTAEDADGRPLRLTSPWYLVHPDPTTDEAFDVTDNGTALTIRADGLAVGHAAEDVVIRSTATGRLACRVTVVTGRRIVCVSVDGGPLPVDLRAVTVAVGNAWQRVVTRRTADPENDDGGEGLTFVRAMCHVLRTVLRVTVIAGVAFVAWKLAMVCCESGPQIRVKFCTSVESVRHHRDSVKSSVSGDSV